MSHFPGARFSVLDTQLLHVRSEKIYEFCTQLGKIHPSGSPCPADEWTLCFFATFLASTVQHSTIKVYLSAVRSLHIDQGFADLLVNCLRLRRVLRGIKRTQGDTSSLRLPVTDDIMAVIFKALDLNIPDHCMFWAACNLAYFGSFASPSLLFPIWPAIHHPSILVWQMFQWTPIPHPRVCALEVRLQKLIHSASGVSST